MNEQNNIIDFPKVIKEQKQNVSRHKKEEKNRLEKARKTSLKRKITAFTVFIVALAIAVYVFASNYYLQIPFTVAKRALIVKRESQNILLNPIAEAKTVEAKVLTDMETIEQYKYQLIMKGMYRKESSKGANDFCKQDGKFNGFGFRQNSRENKCYETFNDVAQRVDEWLDEELLRNGNNLVQALCYYNKGEILQSCSYATEVIAFSLEEL